MIRKNPVASNYVLLVIGLLIVIAALLEGPWPPDYANAFRTETVSHQERMLGQDKPEGTDEVEREPGYILRRVLDGLVYLAVAQVMIALLVLLRWRDRFFLLLLMTAGLYGALYSATLGLVIGPQLAFVGFMMIFIAAGLDWLATTRVIRRTEDEHSVA